MNIIITNIGRRGYLVDYFKTLPNMEGKIFVSDCDRTASGLYGKNDGFFILPKPTDDEEKYVHTLIDLCKKENIKVVLPVIDPEIYILSKYLETFKKNGIIAVVSNDRVLNICFNKIKMNDFLREINVPFPKTFCSLDEFEYALSKGEVCFPIVLKPIFGSGSVDTFFLNDINSLRALYQKGMMIQEKICGIEYGCDTFNTFEGIPVRCVIKRKISMRSGETDKSISTHNLLVEKTLLKIAEHLKHIGNLDCDVILANDTPYVIDMNPRFGGGYPATHAIGVNLIEILYNMLSGKSICPEFGNYVDDIVVMKEIGIKAVPMHGLFDK